jgi:putative RNA 2'-phosphotransferase
MTEELTRASRFLSYVLRHHPDAVGLTLDRGGWVSVDSLLAALAAHDRPITRETLDALVAGTDKVRLERDGDRIRAAQGHTVPVDLELSPAIPPDALYHGTVARFLPAILADGLHPRGRHHVHLSPDAATATAVGARRGSPVVLVIDAVEMHHNGHTFFRAANGVWLTDHVPPRWIHAPGRDA